MSISFSVSHETRTSSAARGIVKIIPGNLPPARRAGFTDRGMTLVEVLLALGIAVLLAGLVFSIYRAVLVTVRVQSERRSLRFPAAAALDLLRRDLERSLAPIGAANAFFILGPGINEATEKRLCFASADAGDSFALSVYDVFLIQYLLQPGSDAGDYSLVRERRPLCGESEDPEWPDREELVRNVSDFRIELFDGSQWTNSWGLLRDGGVPLAARASLTIGDDATFGMHTLIPAGHRIEVEGR